MNNLKRKVEELSVPFIHCSKGKMSMSLTSNLSNFSKRSGASYGPRLRSKDGSLGQTGVLGTNIVNTFHDTKCDSVCSSDARTYNFYWDQHIQTRRCVCTRTPICLFFYSSFISFLQFTPIETHHFITHSTKKKHIKK